MIALDLPTDIWFHILYNFLDAQDIVNFLQTCQATYDLCSSVKLWAHKLRETIRQDGMFIPSFDYGTMSLNDYKRVIFAPARMEYKMETAQTTTDPEGEQSKIRPVAKRVLPLSLSAPILMMLIIPGGRFLVAKTAEEIVVIDIESDVEPTEKMRQKNDQGDLEETSSIFIASPSSDGYRFRLSTVENSGLPTRATKITILEFNPEKRELIRLSSRQIGKTRECDTHSLLSDALAGQLFCYYSDGVIFVWNFVQDTVSSWRVDPSLHNYEGFRKLVIDQVMKYLILFADQTLLFWDIGDILSRTTSGLVQDFPPKWTKKFEIHLFSDPTKTTVSVTGRPTFICSLNSWYYMGHSLPGFDLLAYEGDGMDRLYYHSYEIYYNADKGDEPFIRLAQMHDIPHFQQGQSVLVTKQSRLCNGKMALLWDNRNMDRLFILLRRVLVEDPPGSDNVHLPVKHIYTSDAELVHPGIDDGIVVSGVPEGHILRWDRFSASTFDPASGLFCSTSTDDGITKVTVTDYLGRFGIDNKDVPVLEDSQ